MCDEQSVERSMLIIADKDIKNESLIMRKVKKIKKVCYSSKDAEAMQYQR